MPSALNAATLPIGFDGIAMLGVFEGALLDFVDGLRALVIVVEVKPVVLCDDDALDAAFAFFSGLALAADSSRFSAVSGVSSLSLPMLNRSGSPICNSTGTTLVAPPSPCFNRDISTAVLRDLDLSSVLLVVVITGDDERSPRAGTSGLCILIAGSGVIPWALRLRSLVSTATGIALGAGATWSAPSCLSACCWIQFCADDEALFVVFARFRAMFIAINSVFFLTSLLQITRHLLKNVYWQHWWIRCNQRFILPDFDFIFLHPHGSR